LTLAVVVIAACSVISVLAMLMVSLKLKNLAETTESFLKETQGTLRTLIEVDIKPLLRSAHAAVEEAEGIARGARAGVENVEHALGAIREVGDTVHNINSMVNGKLGASLMTFAAYRVGIRAGVEALMKMVSCKTKKEA